MQPSRIYGSQKTSRRKSNSLLGRTACSCSEPRRIDSHAVGPNTRAVHPGRIRLPHCTKNFELPPGNHRRLIQVLAPIKGRMNVEHWRSTHPPQKKNRCHDAIRVPRTAGVMQKRARLDIIRRVRGVRPVELRRRMQKRARLDIRREVRPGPVITNADPLPVGAESEAHRGAHREADSRGRTGVMCRTPRLPVRPIRVLLKERKHCPSRSIC